MTSTDPTLPRGAKLLTPTLKKSIGNWVEMEYDAEIARLGLTWYRVKDGMGNSGDREDWVAFIPTGNLCVHDYHWKGPVFGVRYSSFDQAIIGQTRQALQFARSRVIEQSQELAARKKTVELLTKALSHD